MDNEDIKILEELIEPFREQNRKGKKLILDIKGIKYEHYEAIENLISRYKELEEGKALTKKQEAMILKAIKQSAEEQITKEMKNYIPKSKVKEILNKLSNHNYKCNFDDVDFLQNIIIEIHQLLED